MLFNDLKAMKWRREKTVPVSQLSKLWTGDVSKIDEAIKKHDFAKPILFRNKITGDMMLLLFHIAVCEKVLSDMMLLSIRNDLAIDIVSEQEYLAVMLTKKGSHEKVMGAMHK